MKLLNKNWSNPTMLVLIIFALVPMVLGMSFWVTFLILTIATVVAVILNRGLHKLDLIYILIAYAILLGYLFPKLVNLGS